MFIQVRNIMKKNQKGFTLVELIVVLVILAILAAILVPALLGYIDRAKDQQLITNAGTAYKVAQTTATEFYAKAVPINPENSKDARTTATNGYWIPVTNTRTGLNGKGTKLPYIAEFYRLISAESLPDFYAVAVIDDNKPGMVRYMTYYDVASKKVAYWDYKSQNWTIEENVEAPPSEGGWKHVLCSSGISTETFSVYFSKNFKN